MALDCANPRAAPNFRLVEATMAGGFSFISLPTDSSIVLLEPIPWYWFRVCHYRLWLSSG